MTPISVAAASRSVSKREITPAKLLLPLLLLLLLLLSGTSFLFLLKTEYRQAWAEEANFAAHIVVRKSAGVFTMGKGM